MGLNGGCPGSKLFKDNTPDYIDCPHCRREVEIWSDELVITCPHCKEEFTPTEEHLMELNLTPDMVSGRTFFRGAGCEYCRHTGYSGRMALYEFMLLNDELRELIMTNSSTNVLRESARKHGMRTLREVGLMAIYDGQTTIDEVVAQTIAEDTD